MTASMMASRQTHRFVVFFCRILAIRALMLLWLKDTGQMGKDPFGTAHSRRVQA